VTQAPRFNKACGGQQVTWGLTESTYYQLANPITARKFYVQLTGAPGNTHSYTFTIRRNGTDTAVQVVISDSQVTDNSGTNSVAISGGDRIDIENTPNNNPAAQGAFYGFVLDTGG
jgi:hypothetical protein